MIIKVSFSEILVYFDAPQLAFCKDQNGDLYLAQAVDLERNEDNYLVVKISEDTHAALLEGRVDVRQAFFKAFNSRWYTFSLGKEEPFRLHLKYKKVWEIPPEDLPGYGMYLDKITNTSATQTKKNVLSDYSYKIDGSWEVKDFSNFHNLYNEFYSFLYLTRQKKSQASIARASTEFQKYPWRGGLSSVFFYDGIYSHIPRQERPYVVGMEFHSPGEITIRAKSDMLDSINKCFSHMIKIKYSFDKSYSDVYVEMKRRGMLRRDTSVNVGNLSKSDIKFLELCKTELENAMGLKIATSLDELTGNPLTTVKILQSLWRRLYRIREFVFTEKLKIV